MYPSWVDTVVFMSGRRLSQRSCSVVPVFVEELDFNCSRKAAALRKTLVSRNLAIGNPH